MSKVLRWKVPFVSTKGVQYEIRIYDEGYTGSVVTLQAGETPITTQEDASDDFFTPVRPSTGTISVIDPDGTLMEQLIPANNTARPVQLVSINRTTTPATETIEWQGFLSCEAYQQDYTAVAQELELSIISVLEAMGSVQLSNTTASFKKIRMAIADVLIQMSELLPPVLEDVCQCYDSIFFSYESKAILDKYIDTTIFFDKKEVSIENATRYEVEGVTCLEVLTKVATFMGMVVREQGTNLYFQRIGESVGMNEYTYYHFTTDGAVYQSAEQSSIAMSGMTYRGKAHSKSIMQGAKAVSVLAGVETYNANLDIPMLEYGELTHYQSGFLDADLYVDEYSSLLSTIKTRHFSIEVAKWILVTGQASTYGPASRNQSSSTEEVMMENSVANKGANAPALQNNITTYVRLYTGAVMCNARFSGESDYTEGLYCLVLPNTIGTASHPSRVSLTHPIVELKDKLLTCYSSGCLKFTTDAKLVMNSSTASVMESGKISISIKHGSLYWTGSNWGGQTILPIEIEDGNFKKNWTSATGVAETDGYLVPVNPNAVGNIEIQIWSMASDAIHQQLSTIYGIAEMFLSSLSCEYVPLVQMEDSDRSENRYYRNLLANFKDEIEITTDLCTYNVNKQSPSVIRTNTSGTRMSNMIYYTDDEGTYDIRRPENDLLDRMADYYGSNRRTVVLEIEHPATALPLLTVNGYDGKHYLPIAEDRDWQTDQSKLICMEMAQS